MLVLLTGASGAGKSTYACNLVKALSGNITFISTEIPQPEIKADAEALRREGFVFVERFTDVAGLDISGGAAILDCLCNLTANEMFDEIENVRGNVADKITKNILALNSRFELLVVITNDVSSDGNSYTEGTSEYIKTLCEINRTLAAAAYAVYELCVSIPTVIKGELLLN